MQLVIGLLCNEDGHPVSIEVFPGNTPDPHTLAAQLAKVKTWFGVQEITFVGDRGMIKGQHIEDRAQHGFHYITAITKPQIEKLLRQGTFQRWHVGHTNFGTWGLANSIWAFCETRR